MSKYARNGAIIGTTILPGAGTVAGAVTGGLIDLFSGPEAQQQQANIGGRSIDARQIWEQIHPGTADSLTEGASAAGTLQSVHDNRAGLIDEINKAMDAAWQGNASQQVQAGAHPLGIWLRDSASNLQKSGTYLNNQGEAFGSAHSKVQEIAATPPHEGLLDHVNPFSDKDEEIEKYNQQGQTNVQAFQDYYNASAQNAAGMPQYQAWQGNNFSDGGDHNGKDPGGGGKNVGNLPPGGGGGGFTPNTGSLGNTGKTPQYNAKLPNTNDYSSDPNKYQGNPPNIGYKPPSWNDGTTAAGYTPSTSGTDFTNGFGPGGSSYGSGSGSGSGSGGGYGGGSFGAGGFGPGGSGSLGAGSSTGSGAAGAGGGVGGAGRGGVGAGAAGAGGRAGTSGMAGMGGAGGRGKGSDDEEHQSKYLVSEDPNELFGTDELTAPPVIGE